MRKNFTSISSKQFALGWITNSLAINLLFGTSITLTIAKQDVWLSVFIGSFIGLLAFITHYKLVSKFPNSTISNWSTQIFGKFLGSLIVLIYVILFFVYCLIATIDFAEIMNGVFIPETQPFVYYNLLVIPVLYCTVLGITVAYRLNVIIIYISIPIIFLIFILNYNQIDLTNFLPAFQCGVKPILEGTLVIGNRITFTILLIVLYPMISNKDKLINTSIKGYFIIIILIETVVLSIAIFGVSYTEKMNYLLLEVARNISISDAFSRLDIFIVLFYITWVFFFVTCFLYCSAILIKDLLGFKNHKYIVVFLGVMILIITKYINVTTSQLTSFTGGPLTYFSIFATVILPLIMLIFVSVKMSKN